MAARSKTAPAPEAQSDQSPQLEDPDPRIRAVMGKWGRATEEAMTELGFFAPGWEYFLRGVYDIVDGVMKGDQ